MKILIILLFQVIVVFCQKQIVEQPVCLEGIIEEGDPPVGLACLQTNEVYACAYGEARCPPVFVCGTPPCHWGCYCRTGYKRYNGQCVRFCPLPPIKKPIEIRRVE